MNKFGLMGEEDDVTSKKSDLSDKLARFPPVAARTPIDVRAFDEAAAAHGFVSREAPLPGPTRSRRRRIQPTEPTRHLAIRCRESFYDRFLRYADHHGLTYHDALERLLDDNDSGSRS
jgi:hypothetical protein